MWQRTIDCLGFAVGVRTDAPAIVPLLEGVLRSYAEATRPAEIAYVLSATGPQLVRDDQLLSTWEVPLELVAAFEIDLYNSVVLRTPGVPLHSGAITDGEGRALIFAGRSGAGKSTLMRTLLARGFRYLSEECNVLLGEQRARGLARALNIDDPLLPVPAGYTCDRYAFRPGRVTQMRMFHPPESQIWRGDARAVGVVAITHAPDADNELVSLSSGESLTALWPAMFRHEPEMLGRIPAAFDSVPTWRLHTSTPEHALEQITRLAETLGLRR
ncbi:MAG: hypothetical protein ABI175_21880 [Polyangiales bacterium]